VAAVLVALPVLLVALVIGTAPAASAHNTLISSDPKDGTTVAEPPAQLTLTFNDDILTVGSAMQVTGPDGAVDLDAPTVDGPRLVQQLPDGLPAGGYEVVWRETSADGHPIDGTLRFTASAGAAPATPATPAQTSSAAGAPSTSGSAPGGAATTQAAPSPAATEPAADTKQDGGIPAWVWIVAAVGLVGAAAVAFAAARRARDQNPG
jgi:methionine-rich copper-binding protein CopC